MPPRPGTVRRRWQAVDRRRLYKWRLDGPAERSNRSSPKTSYRRRIRGENRPPAVRGRASHLPSRALTSGAHSYHRIGRREVIEIGAGPAISPPTPILVTEHPFSERIESDPVGQLRRVRHVPYREIGPEPRGDQGIDPDQGAGEQRVLRRFAGGADGGTMPPPARATSS